MRSVVESETPSTTTSPLVGLVSQEHPNPTTTGRSPPPYLDATLERKADAVPSFSVLQSQWRDAPPIRDRLVTERDIRPYVRPNYEAQQPSAYYSAIAPL